jgi:hypothetical protein
MVTQKEVRALVSLAVFALSAITLAEDGSRIQTVAPQPGWGITDASFVVKSAWDFQGVISTVPWVASPQLYRYRLSGSGSDMVAGVQLPNGALVTSIRVEACDDSDIGSVELSLVLCLAGTDENCAILGVATGVDDTPGCGIYAANLENLDIVIDNAIATYHLLATTEEIGVQNSFRSARLYYRLQVSPAPAQATFGDVPTDHPYFRFIEALVASGITAGCGGGNYCPNSAITRGQMAVFLSTALGLHWE